MEMELRTLNWKARRGAFLASAGEAADNLFSRLRAQKRGLFENVVSFL